ncbi:J domain-containing protein [Aetokthonos hydrillicola Thurmond2011]|jgi:curved DNA-binding protein CbpA|uniref:J domain-containing protein n=1 Tax=Aetokthonos hydrillicola Thurmond2011 TaxID=2712845 RepID=A0AAP5ICN3_9CYAN|nr:J domain-containing protein [Aetokthonos hydrillicola]MBO3462435.1 J domain-containing protein [Aetokthonos hydrillicola CCALA 1050]MBW4590928.1 J domain-containing protein [Aetokthonos hydrillicola CCALA 1050]MDR9899182.1 J domain-containing protein [Aetokthonos hydrillicola Thurmond2011]
MSFKIDRGLFKYDVIDHHAILCVPLDADVKEIRKRYLKIARLLHPDTSGISRSTEKQLATELLSKLVNPAYEKLSQEKKRAEYITILSHIGKRLAHESGSVELTTDIAKQLLTVSVPNVEYSYRAAIAKIAETQYNSLEEAVPVIAQISELNLVYLMRGVDQLFAAPLTIPQLQPTSTHNPADTPQSEDSGQPKEESAVVQYMRRAQEFMAKNQLTQARVELQDALKLEPNNSRCHSLIGVVYFKQNQITMAKVHFERTLQLDPNDRTALAGKSKIEQLIEQNKTGVKSTVTQNTGAKQQDKDKSGGGGLFGGLFGGKRK